MNKNVAIMVFAMIMIGVTGAFVLYGSNMKVSAVSLKADSPIRINSDVELVNYATSAGWRGDGSAGNPYIAENYSIDVGNERSGFYLGNTRCML